MRCFVVAVAACAQATAQSADPDAPTSPIWQFVPIDQGQPNCVDSIRFSPDGSLLAVWGQVPKIWLVDASTGTIRRELKVPSPISDLCFGQDRNTLYAVGEDEQVGVVSWNISTGEQTSVPSITAKIIHATPTALLLIDRGGWQELSLPELVSIDREPFQQQLIPLCVDSNSKGLLAVDVMANQLGQRPNLVWFDLKTKLPIPISTTADNLAAACMIPETDGLFAYSEAGLGGVKLGSVNASRSTAALSTAARQPIQRLGRSVVDHLAATLDGRFLLASEQSGTLRIWEMEARDEVCELATEIGHVSALDVGRRKSLIAITVQDPDQCRVMMFRMWDAVQSRLLPRGSNRTMKEWIERLDHPKSAEAYAAVAQLAQNPKRSLPQITEYISRIAIVPAEHDVSTWITDLDSPRFSQRRSAYNALLNVRDLIIPHLEEALKSGQTLGTQLSLQRLLCAAPADSDLNPRTVLQGMRLLSVLEMIDDSQAQKLLEVMKAGHPSARVRRAASHLIVNDTMP
jgi:hypothetical protein